MVTKVELLVMACLTGVACGPSARSEQTGPEAQPALAWSKAPLLADFACRVQIRRGPGEPSEVRGYDEDGRIRFGRRAGEDNTRWEIFHYDAAKRLSEVRSFAHYESIVDSMCDVPGGCDEPEKRIVHRRRYTYGENDHLTSLSTLEHWFTREAIPGAEYRRSRQRARTTTYEYNVAGQMVGLVENGKAMTIRWDNGRPVEATYRGGYTRVRYDDQDRPVAVDRKHIQMQNRYDDEGRLIRRDFSTPPGVAAHFNEWSYDSHGRVVKHFQTRINKRPASQLRSEHRYEYDTNGRLARAILANGTPIRYSYTGTCGKVDLSPKPRNAVNPFTPGCQNSPHRFLNRCAGLTAASGRQLAGDR